MNRSHSIPAAAFLAVAFLASAAAVAPPPASAQAIVATGQSFLSGSVLVGERDADGARRAGLALEIAPGWKTYWRNPGESGLPPSFDWKASENLADIRFDWPSPLAFDSFGMRTLGYAGRVVLPMTLVPIDPARPIALRLDASLGVCREICVLEEVHLALTVAPGDGAPDAAAIAEAMALVPPPGAEAGVELVACRIAGAGTDRSFTARVTLPEPVADPIVVLEAPGNAWFHGETVAAEGAALDIGATLSLLSGSDWIERSDIRITVLAPGLAADIRGCTPAKG